MKIINIPSGPLMVNSYIAWDEKSGDGFIVDPGGFNPRMEETINKEKINLKYVAALISSVKSTMQKLLLQRQRLRC